MYDRRLSEFNYKFLNNILCFYLFLENCTLRLNAKCDHFDEDSEDLMHLFYGCHNVNRVWKNLSKILKFPVFCKEIVIGIYEDSNSKTSFRNTIITDLSY